MMRDQPFRIVALTPAGRGEPTLVMAADRAGCLGVVNAEVGPLPMSDLEWLAGRTRQPFGVKLPRLDAETMQIVGELAPRGLGWLMLDAAFVLEQPGSLARCAEIGVKVIVEATEWDDRLAGL